MSQDNIKGVTLRVAIFFGLTTFTLCIAIFYTDSILDDTRSEITRRDSTITYLQGQIEEQQRIIQGLENDTKRLTNQLEPATSIDQGSEQQ